MPCGSPARLLARSQEILKFQTPRLRMGSGAGQASNAVQMHLTVSGELLTMRRVVFWVTVFAGATAAYLMYKRGVPPGKSCRKRLGARSVRLKMNSGRYNPQS